MIVSFEENIDKPFVLRLDCLKKIWDPIKGEFEKVDVSMRCSDKASRKFSTWNEIRDYKNQPEKEVIGLSVYAREYSGGESKEVSIFFRSDSEVSPMSIGIKGSEGFVDTLKEEIYSSIEDAKIDHPVLSRINYAACSAVILAMVISLGIMLALGKVARGDFFDIEKMKDQFVNNTFSVLASSIIGILIPPCTLLGGKALDRLMERLYPPGFFALGQGEKRYKRLEKIRRKWSRGAYAIASLVIIPLVKLIFF